MIAQQSKARLISMILSSRYSLRSAVSSGLGNVPVNLTCQARYKDFVSSGPGGEELLVRL